MTGVRRLACVLVLLAACGGAGEDVDTAAPATTTTTTTASTTPPTVAPAASCTVTTDPSGPIEELGFVRQQIGDPPAGWVAPPNPVELDEAAGAVRVDWGTGTLEVTGVRTDFSAEEEITVEPAAVADVTGDDVPDLIVANQGIAAVVVGPTEGTFAFADIGTAAPGWQSPPIQPADVRIPLDTGSVEPLWDLTGDGVDDFAVYSEVRRAEGPTAFYAGKACAAG